MPKSRLGNPNSGGTFLNVFRSNTLYIVAIKIGLLEQWIENDLSGRVNPYRLGFAPILNAKFKDYSTPAATLHTNIKACGSFKPHFIRINPSVEELVRCEDHRGCRAEHVYANLLWATFREEVSRTIKVELVPDLVLAVAPVRLHNLQDDCLVDQCWRFREDILVSRILSK